MKNLRRRPRYNIEPVSQTPTHDKASLALVSLMRSKASQLRGWVRYADRTGLPTLAAKYRKKAAALEKGLRSLGQPTTK